MRWTVVLPLAVLAALGITAIAFAHAEPATVKPGDGAVLAQAPAEVTIVMTQEMARQSGANDISVFDSSGTRVNTASAVIDNADRKRISVALPAGVAVGTYTVKWKTLSADDGDAASGQYTFTYDPSKPPSAGKETLVDVPGLGGTTPAAKATSASAGFGGSGGGISWVLLLSVAVGMFALGSGATFLLVRRSSL